MRYIVTVLREAFATISLGMTALAYKRVRSHRPQEVNRPVIMGKLPYPLYPTRPTSNSLLFPRLLRHVFTAMTLF